MNDFKKGGFRKSSGGFGGRAKFGGDSKFKKPFRPKHDRNSRDSERTEMFSTTCSECHKLCDVPFRPSGDKPIYCRECFANKRETPVKDFQPQRKQFEHSNIHREQGNENIKLQLAKIESKLNRILEIINPPLHEIKVGLDSVKEVTFDSGRESKQKTISKKTKSVTARKVTKRVKK